MSNYDVKMRERKQIREYIERFENLNPRQILRYLGDARDFFSKYMTSEGRKFFENQRKSKLERQVSQYSLK